MASLKRSSQTSSEHMPPENLAEAPFNDKKADLILQSSDQVHFHVLKPILSFASAVFADMFSIPSPPSEHQDQIQVVPVSEDSTALDLALRHIYPMQTPEGDKLRYASILAEFMRKYQVEGLNKFITSYLTNSIERDPVGVYAIAVTYGYDGVGANAARSYLNLRFSRLKSPYLRCSTTEVELLKYHAACGDAASAFASTNRTWSGPLAINGIFTPKIRDGINCQSCSMPDFIYQNYTEVEVPSLGLAAGEIFAIRNAPRCVWNYLYRSALVLARQPSAKAITTEAFVMESNKCDRCAQYMRGQLLEFSVLLGKEIKKAVEEVSLLLRLMSDVCSVQWCMRIPGRFPYQGLFLRRRFEVAPLLLQIDHACKCMALCCSSGRYVDP